MIAISGRRTGQQQPATGQVQEPDTENLTAKIAAYRTANPAATQVEIANHLGMSERNLRRKLTALRLAKPVIVEGSLSTSEESAG